MFVAIHCHKLLVGGSPKPQYTQKVFCGYAFRERFLYILESSKSPDSEKSQVIFCSMRRRII